MTLCKKYSHIHLSTERMKNMNWFIRRMAGLFAALCLVTAAAAGYLSGTLPESYYVSGEGMPDIGVFLEMSPSDSALEVSGAEKGVEHATVKLFGLIPIKEAEIKRTDAPVLIPGGYPIGIKLLTDGVVVVSTKAVYGDDSPAIEAGIEPGDCILTANGEILNSSNRLAQIIMNSHGEEIEMTVRRDGRKFETSVTPLFSEEDGTYKAGLWIKDSSAGVGTITYIDPKTGSFGALGHPISDSQTQKILPLGSGEIVDVTITGCDKGASGCPGELFGTFLSGLASGSIVRNCEQGIFGNITYLGGRREAIPIAFRTEVETGKASILTTVSGSVPQEYEIEIEKLSRGDDGTKNMVIRVTDPRLLETTGGIVQGMSGSPIIQNGKLVGAVTHVFVSDPQRGYGIFIENMLEAAGQLK